MLATNEATGAAAPGAGFVEADGEWEKYRWQSRWVSWCRRWCHGAGGGVHARCGRVGAEAPEEEDSG